jgi:large subunit ribosomal protein L3
MKTILGTKQEMTQVFDEESKNVIPCTIIKSADCIIADLKTIEKDGYNAVVLGIGRKNNKTKSEIGKFSKLGYVPNLLKEVRVDSVEGYEVGSKVLPSSLELGDEIVIQGVSKGKGFQGVVKRWHFKGGPKTHGQSDRQRAPGSIGQRSTPGRVYAGKKMPGRMGNDTVTLNSVVIRTDDKEGLISLKGSVPGGRNSIILIRTK